MIHITGSVLRSFVFPAQLPAAYEFYSDMNRTLNYLSHISILRRYSPTEYRMQFMTTELGVYRVRMACDIQTELDRKSWAIRIHPLDKELPVKSNASMYSLTGQGYFASESLFSRTDEGTHIVYKIWLRARLQPPLGLRFMPGSILNEIARNITQRRIHEIADGFIERSTRAYV